jgi:hypothetical protein
MIPLFACDSAVTALELGGRLVEGICRPLCGADGHRLVFHAVGNNGFVSAPGRPELIPVGRSTVRPLAAIRGRLA